MSSAWTVRVRGRELFSYKEMFKESVENFYEVLLCDVKQELAEFRVVCVYRTPDCCTSGLYQLAKVMTDFSATNLPRFAWKF